jgi:hypothetical protein
MKTLLRSLLPLLFILPCLAASTPAQSGTLVVPPQLTNCEVDLRALLQPLAGPGMLYVELQVDGVFEHTCAVQSTFASPFPAVLGFCDTLEIVSAGQVLGDGSHRRLFPMFCGLGWTSESGSNHVFAEAAPPLTASLVLRSRARSSASVWLPFESGTAFCQVGTTAGAVVHYTFSRSPPSA